MTNKPKRLDLRQGAKLRLEVSRMADDRLLLKQIAVLKHKGKTVEIEQWKRECSTEEELWANLVTLSSDRLCALSEIA
jgi:hypothetical protein